MYCCLLVCPRHERPQRHRGGLLVGEDDMAADTAHDCIEQRIAVDGLGPGFDDPVTEQRWRSALSLYLLTTALHGVVKIAGTYSLISRFRPAGPRVIKLIESRELIDEILRRVIGFSFLFCRIRYGSFRFGRCDPIWRSLDELPEMFNRAAGRDPIAQRGSPGGCPT